MLHLRNFHGCPCRLPIHPQRAAAGRLVEGDGEVLDGRRQRRHLHVDSRQIFRRARVSGTPFARLFADDKWSLIISKKTGEWGTAYPGPSEDLARIDMKVSALPSAVENFTIAFDKTAGGCTLRMDWETTRASVEITKM